MAMRTAADHPDFAPFVSTSIERVGTVKRNFVDPVPVHIRERLFRVLASSLKKVWKTVSLRPDEVHLRGDRILHRFTHEFGITIDDPRSTPKGLIDLSRLIRTRTNSLPHILEGASKNAEKAFANMDRHRVDEVAFNRAHSLD